jgi:two-component system, OmpR family, response regulator
LKVLIIDDEEDVRKIAALSLVHVGGMDVCEASGGAEGLRLAASQKPDAILLDVSMPGMDGPTTLAALKADPATAPIPVIFVTARAMEKEIEDLKALGAEGVLTKPFNAMKLAEDVRAMLGGRG